MVSSEVCPGMPMAKVVKLRCSRGLIWKEPAVGFMLATT